MRPSRQKNCEETKANSACAELPIFSIFPRVAISRAAEAFYDTNNSILTDDLAKRLAGIFGDLDEAFRNEPLTEAARKLTLFCHEIDALGSLEYGVYLQLCPISQVEALKKKIVEAVRELKITYDIDQYAA